MTASKQSESIRIELDLRTPRAEAEQRGLLDEHAKLVSNLSSELKDMISSNPDTIDSTISIEAMKEIEPSSKSYAQVIDSFIILLGPIGVVTLAKLILQIVEVCRTKIPTSYEMDIEGIGKFKITGPKIQPDDLVALIQKALPEIKQYSPVKLYLSSGKVLRIKAKATN